MSGRQPTHTIWAVQKAGDKSFEGPRRPMTESIGIHGLRSPNDSQGSIMKYYIAGSLIAAGIAWSSKLVLLDHTGKCQYFGGQVICTGPHSLKPVFKFMNGF
jgi:hypothetical protein